MHRLPTFPQGEDMWKRLKSETRPIVIYGMGNGADKLIKRFESLGIRFADIFASDSFVRGHSFHGIRVKSFSEIKELYSDFVVVLSFATRLEAVIEFISNIAEKYDLYVPDMPVADEHIYFDSEFYNAHFKEIKEAFFALADEESKNVFCSVIRYKLSGRIEYLLKHTSTKEEMYSLFQREKIRKICDVGAYSGDTLSEALEFFPTLSEAVCVEPDAKTFKRLLRFVDGLDGRVKARCINAAAWSESGDGEFSESANRNSSVVNSSTQSFENKVRKTQLVKIDDILPLGADYIKYDVEGAEREALLGSVNTIERYKPTLLVSVYHKSADLFDLINVLKKRHSGYRFYLRRQRCLPAWETNLIMLPGEES